MDGYGCVLLALFSVCCLPVLPKPLCGDYHPPMVFCARDVKRRDVDGIYATDRVRYPVEKRLDLCKT